MRLGRPSTPLGYIYIFKGRYHSSRRVEGFWLVIGLGPVEKSKCYCLNRSKEVGGEKGISKYEKLETLEKK